ncbi:DNA mismatch repair protein Mlh1-like [Dysidea avara]|uniref:DNA mismatch repair protein Mlh1-like n=1 Tax=Dysidea avara TaxID=196820 RepID=UPI00331B9AA0
MAEPKQIRKLDEDVVNKIAAGEVIQRPANAIKEMVENSLDACSSSIQVSVKSGGLKLIQIQDNGCGIQKDDMPLLCERFTTSKLEKFEDLSSISTYGFRGEALASITHVAHVTVTTRTANSKCAYKATYQDGKIVGAAPGQPAEARPCAGNHGTLISVEDLFYNMPSRRRALKSASDEYSRIADVVNKYAIHNAGVAMTLKKQGEAMADLKTSTSSNVVDNISTVYGPSVARELLSLSCEDTKLGFKMTGYISNANYSVKKLNFILFINHRLVDSTNIRKSLESVYANYLPKHSHPFIYLNIEITPSSVDVNVHPTKHEVFFLHEDLIIEALQKCVEDKLLGCNSSRTYYTQALLPTNISSATSNIVNNKKSSTGGGEKPSQYAYQMVRTDSREMKLDAFVRPPSLDATTRPSSTPTTNTANRSDPVDMDTSNPIVIDDEGSSAAKRPRENETANQTTTSVEVPAKKRRHHKPVHLTSVLNLQQRIKENQHKELTELFKNYKFVGCVDQTRSLVQYMTKLYLIDVSKVSKELFYQLMIFDFANFGTLRLSTGAPINQLSMLMLESSESGWTEDDGPKDTLAKYIKDLLCNKTDMLKDYFSMEINEDGEMLTLPLLLDSYTPNLDNLPRLLLKLATEVNWDSEQECFETLSREFSSFYSVQYDPYMIDCIKPTGSATEDMPATQSDLQQSSLQKEQPWRWITEHVIFPAFRTELVPPRQMAEDGSVLQIADLHDLYKVFERC